MGRIVHGMSKDIAYRCWKGMNQRCYNPENPIYKHYGGKGVTVCAEWRHSFARFLIDVGPRPSLGYSLDRFPNGRGNYEPGNVRWATDLEQGRNKPDYNVIVEWKGERRTLSAWTELRGFSKELLRERLINGWSVEEAMTVPASPLPRPSQRTTHPNVNLHVSGRYCVYAGNGSQRKYIGMAGSIAEGIILRDRAQLGENQ